MSDFTADSFPQFADRLEPITFQRRGRPPGIAIAAALRRAVTPKREDRSSGWAAVDTVWHIPEGSVPGGVRPGDVLTDGGGHRWTVLVASPTTAGRIIAWTRDWEASFSAAQSVELQQAEPRKGPHGEPLLQWRVQAAGIPAQFLSCHLPQAADGQAQTTYRVLLLWDGPPGQYRLKTNDGTLYGVLKIERPGLPGHPALLHVTPQEEA